MRFLYILLLLLSVNINNLIAQENLATIEISFNNIKTKKGTINIVVYKNNTDFKNRKKYKNIILGKSNLVLGKIFKYKFKLPPGTYGIAVLDDENSDKKMEKNFIGLPKEGFGFSNYYHTGMTSPDFKLFSFLLKPNETKKISVRFRYM